MRHDVPVLSSRALNILCLMIIVFGILLRFFEITHNNFIFYDEGMYLNHNRELLAKIKEFPPKDLNELLAIFKIIFYSALATAKWLWFFISNLRIFVGGPDAFYFNRVVSAVCGVLTVGLTYMFTQKVFKSKDIALLSAAVLAVLPSHVFYSRLAMQESFSTLCLLVGAYLYISGCDFRLRSILAAIFFSAVFFTNYRMVVLPVLLVVLEIFYSMSHKRSWDWVKWLGTTLAFYGIIFWIGSLNHGSNRFITTAWMTHQAQMAAQEWRWLDLFSYPYDIFVLEGFLFGLLFFSNVYWLYKRDWQKFLPGAIVLAQMAMFSFAAERGARYLCVVLPFAVMAGALSIRYFVLNAGLFKRWAALLLLGMVFCSLAAKSVAVAQTPSGYEQAVKILQQKDPQAKILATQPLLVNLWVSDPSVVESAPKDFRDLIIRYSQGYRYLILDPQAYVSWTATGEHFTTPLADYLGFIRAKMSPVVKFSHLNLTLMERFVLDHNENFLNSANFLNRRDEDFGAVYVYDLTQCIAVMQKVAESLSKNK